MKQLPESIKICGIIYSIVRGTREGYNSGSDIMKQEIFISDELPFPKQLQRLSHELAYSLLNATGLKEAAVNRTYIAFGNILYRFIRDNDFTFIRNQTYDLPIMLWVAGLPYTKTEDHKEYMEAKSLGGEVCYDQLSIRLDPDLEPEIKTVVYLHEAAHAMLYEAATNLESREDIVEPLSWSLFQFFKDNDLEFTKY